MNWLKNVNVGAKLIGSFLIMALLIGLVGFIGISNMNTINDADTDLYQKETLGLSHVKEANLNLMYGARSVRNLLLATTQEERQKHVSKLKEFDRSMREELDAAEKRFYTEKGKETVKKLRTAYEEYAEIRTKTVDMALSEKLPEDRESVKFASTVLRPK